ncbi:MAG: hypothetical protein H6686_05690 [Fibrobacteria bacterium]|nr:hypothetical protein [Fibrobacteria bacterium]
MISLSPNPVKLGDTTRLSWHLPPGSRILSGPQPDDSLAVQADTSHPGQWLLQPLAPGERGGDTLHALSPAGDTLRDVVPAWRVASTFTTSDSSQATLIAPRDREVPFPWTEIGLGFVLLGLVALGAWSWLRFRATRPVPPPPPPPAVPPELVAGGALDALEEACRAGLPPREAAFRAGIILREFHGAKLSWPNACDSTSAEWRAQVGRNLPEASRALERFLSCADPLRYADSTSDAAEMLQAAREVLGIPPGGSA